MGAAVTGWGAALPPRSLSSAQLGDDLGLDAGWIQSRTGIESRRLVSPGESGVQLATEAALRALACADLDAKQIDMVIVATCTPDHGIPANAPLVQAALGIEGSGAFDINAACAGFVHGLYIATALIESGSLERVLVCGVDVLSRVIDFTDPSSCILFGDGAGAVVVEHCEGPARLGPFLTGADGSQRSALFTEGPGGFVQMTGREVYRRAVHEMSEAVNVVLARASLEVKDIDLVVAHQANARIVEAVGERLELRDDQVFINIARLGNTSSASIPIALAQAAEQGRLAQDDLVVLTALGAGFVWAAGIVRWGGIASHRIHESAEAALV